MAPGRIRDGVALTNALAAGAPDAAPEHLRVGGVEFREIADDDVEQVVALWDGCGLVRPWNDAHRDVADARVNPTSTVLVAHDEGGAVVATALAGYEGHRGWIYYVAVAPALQGAGLGRDAVVAAEAWLLDAGARKVRLMVRTTNTPVLGFYERLGYTDAECTVLGRDLV
ncbi:GNAT family acetyltransferase [Oerskovia sp. NPDC060287]|uniref:GNAT family acetyltransferase n=1 Tax=Oerskovia sp. NPDC060287 TaxID=3347095 RepID=UPI00364AA153